MAGELLLINPRGRKGRKKSVKRVGKKRSGIARKAKAAFKIARRRVSSGIRKIRSRRKSGGMKVGGSIKSALVPMIKNGLIGGVGAVAIDYAWAKVAPKLPASIGTGNGAAAAKALATVVAGVALSKVTRGMSKDLAAGALAVQARDLISQHLPMAGRVGYYSPTAVTQGTARFNPTGRVGAFIPGRVPGLANAQLGAFVPGRTPGVSAGGRVAGLPVRSGKR
jgi:hypothetical protein